MMLSDIINEIVNKKIVFAELFKKYRESGEIHKSTIAKLLNTSPQYIGKIEKGDTVPSFLKILQLMDLFKIVKIKEKIYFMASAFFAKMKDKDDFKYFQQLYFLFQEYIKENNLKNYNHKINEEIKVNSDKQNKKMMFYEFAIWTNYFRKIFQNEKICALLLFLISNKADTMKFYLHNLEIYKSGIRFIAGIPNSVDIESFIRNIKTTTEKGLKEQFPHLQKKLPKLWNNDYLAYPIVKESNNIISLFKNNNDSKSLFSFKASDKSNNNKGGNKNEKTNHILFRR